MATQTAQLLRRLRRNPGFTAVVLATFALGIGATTAVYSVVSRVLLRPLPLAEPDRLVTVWTRMPDAKIDQLEVAHAEYLDYRSESSLIEDAGAFVVLPATLTGVGDPAKLQAGLTTASLWSVLRIHAQLGRTLATGDDVKGAEPVAVLSQGLWRSRFGADPAVVGRTIQLDGAARRVVGVMPASFDFTQSAPDVWIPYVLDPNRRDNHHLQVIARMKQGATFAMLQPEMDAIVAGWAKRYTHAHPMFAIPMRELIVGPVRTPLAVLFAAAALVLLVCATNVAGLMLARGEARQREVAIHAALGAGRPAIVRRTLLESVVLAAAGGVLGLLVAKAGLAAILSLEGGALPQMGEVGLDPGVLGFALAISVGAGVVAGLLPAWRASRTDLCEFLKGGGERGATSVGRHGLRGALVVAQTAAAVVLVAGCALLVRSLWRLTRVDPGVDPDHVLAAQLTLPASSYPKPPEVNAFYDRLIDRVRALPGVRSAALVSSLPMRDPIRLILAGGPWQPPNAEPLGAEVLMVSPEYFRTLSTPVVRGRPFGSGDRPGAARVAAVNQAAARALFGDRDPVGTPLSIVQAQPKDPPFEVVAVVADVRTAGPATPAAPQVYLPLAQGVTDIRGVTRSVSVALKTAVEPAALSGPLRAAVWALDPKLAVANVETMDRVVSASLGPQRFQAILLGAFAVLALVLAAIGLYGLLAHAVAARRRELGIRLALGARPGQLLALVLARGFALTGIGVAAGTAVTLGAGRVLEGLLYGTGRADPACLAVTALVLLAAAGAASLVPAWRAGAVNPAQTLREE